MDTSVNVVFEWDIGGSSKVVTCGNNSMLEVPELVKVGVSTISRVTWEALDGIMVLILRVVIVRGGVPWGIRGKEHVGKGLPFMVSEGAHLESG